MRTQQRNFVVEIKSARRRLKTEPKSIWGNTDFKALVRDAEATHPFMQNAVTETSVPYQDLPVKPGQHTANNDALESAEPQLSDVSLVETGEIQQVQQEMASTHDAVAVPAAVERKRGPRKAYLHRGAALSSTVEDAGGALHAQIFDGLDSSSDELALLEEENRRLKKLRAKQLSEQNTQIRTMLARFEI